MWATLEGAITRRFSNRPYGHLSLCSLIQCRDGEGRRLVSRLIDAGHRTQCAVFALYADQSTAG